MSPENLRRALFLRIVSSVLSYCAFVVLGISWVITSSSTLKFVMFIPLVGAVLLLPRKISEDVRGEVEEGSEEERKWVRTGYWLSAVRVVYLLVAIAVLVGLPEIVG